MESFVDSKNMGKHERETVIKFVKEQANGEYWKMIKAEIERMIALEEANQKSIGLRGITQKDIDSFNASAIALQVLRTILNVNNRIIRNQQTWIDKIVSDSINLYQRAANGFVKSKLNGG